MYDKVKDSAFKDELNKFADGEEDFRSEYNIEILIRGTVYTTAGNLQWMHLKSSFSIETIRKREYDVCIIDEVDNVLIDGLSSPALI